MLPTERSELGAISSDVLVPSFEEYDEFAHTLDNYVITGKHPYGFQRIWRLSSIYRSNGEELDAHIEEITCHWLNIMSPYFEECTDIDTYVYVRSYINTIVDNLRKYISIYAPKHHINTTLVDGTCPVLADFLDTFARPLYTAISNIRSQKLTVNIGNIDDILLYLQDVVFLFKTKSARNILGDYANFNTMDIFCHKIDRCMRDYDDIDKSQDKRDNLRVAKQIMGLLGNHFPDALYFPYLKYMQSRLVTASLGTLIREEELLRLVKKRRSLLMSQGRRLIALKKTSNKHGSGIISNIQLIDNTWILPQYPILVKHPTPQVKHIVDNVIGNIQTAHQVPILCFTMGTAVIDATISKRDVRIKCHMDQALLLDYMNDHKYLTIVDFAKYLQIPYHIASLVVDSVISHGVIILDPCTEKYVVNDNYYGKGNIDMTKKLN